MQTCYNCGKQVDDNVLICPDCGALVRRYGKPAPQQEEPVADLTYAPETARSRPSASSTCSTSTATRTFSAPSSPRIRSCRPCATCWT